jgi:hypothetical protein
VEVAEFYSNTTPVSEFANILYEILHHWGNPLVCIERNNQGGQVADRLGLDLGYPKIVNWGYKLAGRKTELLGMVSQRNTKYQACANARYFYSDKEAVVFKNKDTLEELFKDFVKINDSYKAAPGKHDDRTMALIWALMVLHKDLCEQYFCIDETDECGMPSKISPLAWGLKLFENPTSIYTNEHVENIEASGLAPVVFGAHWEESFSEISGLISEGWEFLGGNAPHHDPKTNLTQDQYDAWERIVSYH